MTQLVGTTTLRSVDSGPEIDEVLQLLEELDEYHERHDKGRALPAYLAGIYRIRGNLVPVPTQLPLDGEPFAAAYELGHGLAEHPNDFTEPIAAGLAIGINSAPAPSPDIEAVVKAARFQGVVLVGAGLAVRETMPGDDPFDFVPTRVRIMAAVDVNGIAYLAQHLAHQELIILDSTEDGFEGHIGHEGLRLITLAATRHLDNAADYVDALMGLNFGLDIHTTCGREIHVQHHQTDED